MNLCSHHHEEICYECRKCPLCEVKEQLSSSEKEVSALKDQVQVLENEVGALQGT